MRVIGGGIVFAGIEDAGEIFEALFAENFVGEEWNAFYGNWREIFFDFVEDFFLGFVPLGEPGVFDVRREGRD